MRLGVSSDYILFNNWCERGLPFEVWMKQIKRRGRLKLLGAPLRGLSGLAPLCA